MNNCAIKTLVPEPSEREMIFYVLTKFKIHGFEERLTEFISDDLVQAIFLAIAK